MSHPHLNQPFYFFSNRLLFPCNPAYPVPIISFYCTHSLNIHRATPPLTVLTPSEPMFWEHQRYQEGGGVRIVKRGVGGSTHALFVLSKMGLSFPRFLAVFVSVAASAIWLAHYLVSSSSSFESPRSCSFVLFLSPRPLVSLSSSSLRSPRP